MADLTKEDYYKQLNLDPLTIEIYNKLRQDVLNDVWIHFKWRTLSVKSAEHGGNKQKKLLKILEKGQEGIDAINNSIVKVKPQYGGFVGTKREKDKGIVDPKGWVKHIKSLTTKIIKFKPQEIVDKSKEILEDKIAGGSVKQVTEFIEDDSDTEIFVLEEKPLDKAPENIWDDLEGYKIENVVLNKEIDDIEIEYVDPGTGVTLGRTVLHFIDNNGGENSYQWQVGKPIFEEIDEFGDYGLVGYRPVSWEEAIWDIEKNMDQELNEGYGRNDIEDLLHEKYLVLQRRNKTLLVGPQDANDIITSKDDLIEGLFYRDIVFGEYDDELDKIYKRGDYEETYNVDFDLTKQQKKELEAAKNPNSIFYRTFKSKLTGEMTGVPKPPRMEDYLQKPYHNLSKEKLAVYLRTTDLDDPLSEGARSFGVGPYDWKNHKGPEDISAYNRKRADRRYELGIRGIRSGNEYWKQMDFNPEDYADRRPGKWIYYDEPQTWDKYFFKKLWVWDDGGGLRDFNYRKGELYVTNMDSDEEPEGLFLLSSSDSDSLSEDSESEEDLPSNLIESKTISSIELLEEGKEKPINLIESEIIVSKEEIKMVTYTTSKGKSHTVPYDPLFDGVFTSSSEEEEEDKIPPVPVANLKYPVPSSMTGAGVYFEKDPEGAVGGVAMIELSSGKVLGYHYPGDNDSDSSDLSSLQSDTSSEEEEDFKDIELKPVTPEFNPFDLSGLTDSDEDDPTVITTSLTSVQKLVKEIEKKLPKPFL